LKGIKAVSTNTGEAIAKIYNVPLNVIVDGQEIYIGTDEETSL